MVRTPGPTARSGASATATAPQQQLAAPRQAGVRTSWPRTAAIVAPPQSSTSLPATLWWKPLGARTSTFSRGAAWAKVSAAAAAKAAEGQPRRSSCTWAAKLQRTARRTNSAGERCAVTARSTFSPAQLSEDKASSEKARETAATEASLRHSSTNGKARRQQLSQRSNAGPGLPRSRGQLLLPCGDSADTEGAVAGTVQGRAARRTSSREASAYRLAAGTAVRARSSA
mmetsp:Transcript_37635/g.82608  ORF Transcript_37635/g.82608 Transcript_37635/m.82608 type:complete len:228 (+) Transcript_37635:530-1213(+)